MEFCDRTIACTDLETTGLDPFNHEIIEIGLVLVDQKTGTTLDEFEARIIPEHLETASPRALEINGYNEHDWATAIPLATALDEYIKRTPEAIFTSQNPTFDWFFMHFALRQTGRVATLDYHRLDTFSMGFTLLRRRGLRKFSLKDLCEHLGIEPEPEPHRAMNGARKVAEVYRLLMCE